MKIRTFGTIAVMIIALMLVLPTVVSAQDEEAKYSFASAQEKSGLQAIPGKESEPGVIYFYNVDGNRITHVALEVVETPENWVVEITPALHQQEYSVSGATITVTENLYVEPTQLSLEEIEDVPSGWDVCLTLPNRGANPDGPGYTLAKKVTIIVHVPKSEKYDITGDIKIRGTGSWLGQSGAASIQQQRDFDFTVTTVYDITGPEVPITGKGFDTGKWLPWIILGVVAIAAIASISVLTLRRRAG
jgi:hypothetical protein